MLIKVVELFTTVTHLPGFAFKHSADKVSVVFGASLTWKPRLIVIPKFFSEVRFDKVVERAAKCYVSRVGIHVTVFEVRSVYIFVYAVVIELYHAQFGLL